MCALVFWLKFIYLQLLFFYLKIFTDICTIKENSILSPYRLLITK